MPRLHLTYDTRTKPTFALSTVARRHVVRAPYGGPAIIVRSPQDFYMIIWWGRDRTAIVETAMAQSELVKTPHGHRTDSV